MKNILIDTDIGDDIDDALAVAVALDQTLVKMEPREVNLIFWTICCKNQFNRRELLVNSICKWQTHFDKIRFSAKIRVAFQS